MNPVLVSLLKRVSIKGMVFVFLTGALSCSLGLMIAEEAGVIAVLVGIATAIVLSKIRLFTEHEREEVQPINQLQP
jgi:hypothetical protein